MDDEFAPGTLLDLEDQIMYGLLLAISANQNQSVLESHNLCAALTEAVGRKVDTGDINNLIEEGIIKRVFDGRKKYLVFGDYANEYLHPSTLKDVWPELTPHIRKCSSISSITSQQSPLKNHPLWILASSPTKKMWLPGSTIYQDLTEKNSLRKVVAVNTTINMEKHIKYSEMNSSEFRNNDYLISRGETFYQGLAELLYSKDIAISIDEFNFSNSEWDKLDEQYNIILLDDKNRIDGGIEKTIKTLNRLRADEKQEKKTAKNIYDLKYYLNRNLDLKIDLWDDLGKLHDQKKAIREKKLIIHGTSCPYGLDGDKCRRSLRLSENLGSCYFDVDNCRVEFTPFYKGVYITPKAPVVYLNFEEIDEIMHILEETHNLSTRPKIPKGEEILDKYINADELVFFEFDIDKMHPPYDKTRYFLPAKTIKSIYSDSCNQLKLYGL